MVQHMAVARQQQYCGLHGSADGSSNSVAMGHMVQWMATVLLWATWFSGWQQYCYGPHGSVDGNSIAVGHMAMATVFCGPQGSADGSGNIVVQPKCAYDGL